MDIDVDDILTDAALDEHLGGQVSGGQMLIPLAWGGSTRRARLDALELIMTRFRDTVPRIEARHVTDPSLLRHAVLYGAVARIYELAMSSASDANVFFALEKRYRQRFDSEVQRLIDVIHETLPPDARGRGRRTVSIVRR